VSIIQCLPSCISIGLTSAYTVSVELAFRRTGSNSTWLFGNRICVETGHILQWYQCQNIQAFPKREVSFKSIMPTVKSIMPTFWSSPTDRWASEACQSSSFEALKVQFASRSQDFRFHGPILSYLIKPDLLDATTTQLDLDLFRRTDIDNFEMQHVEFKASELCTSKLDELRKTYEGNCLSAANLDCWTSLPEAFICLKKVAFAPLSGFDSTYTCEQIFCHMKAALSS